MYKHSPAIAESKGKDSAHYFVIGHWSLVIGHWSLVIGHWSLVIGHWSLVIGHWSPVIAHWSLALPAHLACLILLVCKATNYCAKCSKKAVPSKWPRSWACRCP